MAYDGGNVAMNTTGKERGRETEGGKGRKEEGVRVIEREKRMGQKEKERGGEKKRAERRREREREKNLTMGTENV